MSWKQRLKYLLQIIIYSAVILFAVGPAQTPMNDPKGKVRAFTRADEFDYVEWTIDAVITKVGRITLDTIDYLDREEQRQVVLDYIHLVGEIFRVEDELARVYTDPDQENPEQVAEPLRTKLQDLTRQRAELGPLAEAVLQNMLSATMAKMGFTLGGQPLPPVLYHSTPLPWALIVSPRDTIRQDANISLNTSMTLEEHIQLEDEIERTLDISALVVRVGGVGTYPTMVAETTNLNWLAEVTAHEWIHNYLTLRPLGVRYNQNPELRTINETTANLAGDEIGAALILEYFPEFAPPPPPAEPAQPADAEEQAPEPTPPVFDYYSEMHETRVTVDALLADGRIEEAEDYMEARRVFLWENGYRIRKLNQAYFAFHGAYADRPVGSAGKDPVGAAVRQFRDQSDTLLEFVRDISKVKSYDQLLMLVEVSGES